MPCSTQSIQTGVLSKEWQDCLARLQKSHAVERLWNKDLSLWPSYGIRKSPGKEILNWLDLADHLEAGAAHVSKLGDGLLGRGFTDVVFLAISSSSLAAELVSSLALPTRGARFHALSRMEPSGLLALERQIDLKHTLFLVSSKSGKNLEMHSLLLYLLAKTKSAGLSSPAENFIAITEEGSYLAGLAKENRFRAVLSEPHGFRGRFSGILHYGYLLVGLCGLDANKILSSLHDMRNCCRPQTPFEQNPAAQLAAFLAASAQSGFHRLVFRNASRLAPFAARLGHLVGSSSCKEEKGIMPFREVWISNPSVVEKHCSQCILRFADGSEIPGDSSRIPTVSVQLGGIEDAAAEIFKWEVATSLACSLIGVNPFEDPDFGEGRQAAIEYLERISEQKRIDRCKPRLVEGNLSLFVEGELRREISSLSLELALSSFFALCPENGYLAIQNFAWSLPDVLTRMTALAAQMSAQLGVPAQLVDGPWYLHLIGQCYKGGPRGGLALMVTCDAAERIEIPGAGYSFGDLVLALALGDFDAMLSRRRPILRIHMTGTPEQALAQLESAIGKALRTARRKR